MFTNIYKVTSPTVIEKFVDNVAEWSLTHMEKFLL